MKRVLKLYYYLAAQPWIDDNSSNFRGFLHLDLDLRYQFKKRGCGCESCRVVGFLFLQCGITYNTFLFPIIYHFVITITLPMCPKGRKNSQERLVIKSIIEGFQNVFLKRSQYLNNDTENLTRVEPATVLTPSANQLWY